MFLPCLHTRATRSAAYVRIGAVVAGALLATACASPTPATPASPAARAQLELTYLGVAGWRLTDGTHSLLVDPYFSRIDADATPGPLLPNAAAIARHAPAHADVILVGHSHYDHLLDVPAISQRTGATVVGTESTLNVARAAGVPEPRLRRAQEGETFTIGPFSVRAIRGLHSLTGQAPAEIPRNVVVPMKASGYGEGQTLQYLVRVNGQSVLFIGTANFIDGELDGLRPDVAVIATGLRGKIPDYSCRLMRALGQPRLVLANHFDAHSTPLGPKQMDIGDEGRASLAKFADEIHACSPRTKVVVPTHFQPIAF